MRRRVAGLQAEGEGRYLSKDGQEGSLLWNEIHEKEPSFQAEGISGEKTLQKEGLWHI